MRFSMLLLALLTACKKEEPSKVQKAPGPVDGREYFPIKPGNKWMYTQTVDLGEGEALERRAYHVVAGAEENMLYILDSAKPADQKHPYAYSIGPEGVVTKMGFLGPGRLDFDPPFPELPSLIRPGIPWKWSGKSRNNPMTLDSVFEGLETITVTAGTFECIRIKRTSEGGPTLTHWYAKGVGLVRAEVARAATGKMPASRTRMDLNHSVVKE